MPSQPPKSRQQHAEIAGGIRHLPPYARSLLRISVPVTVTLASTSQTVERITDIRPGTMLQFDKSCDEMLTLAVGEHEIAVGEAVKVGDKYGLRITSMKLPDERFGPIRGKRE